MGNGIHDGLGDPGGCDRDLVTCPNGIYDPQLAVGWLGAVGPRRLP